MSRTLIFLLITTLIFQLVGAAGPIPVPKAPSTPSIPKVPAPEPEPVEPGSDAGGFSDPGGEWGNPGGGTGVGGVGGTNPPTVPFSNPADLGLFSQNGGQTPFTESESKESWEELLDKMRDILENISSALDSASPTAATAFIPVPPSTTTFKASEPSEACGAWASLTAYCSGADPSCGCYSRSYYVPDQWNSLAARCANATGTMLSAAAQNTAYCTANIRNATSTRFAAATPTPSTTQAPTSYATAVRAPVSSAEKFGVGFVVTGLALVFLSFMVMG